MKIIQHFNRLLMIALDNHQKVIENRKQKITADGCEVQEGGTEKTVRTNVCRSQKSDNAVCIAR